MITIIIWVLSGNPGNYGAAASRSSATYENFQKWWLLFSRFSPVHTLRGFQEKIRQLDIKKVRGQ